MEPQLQNWENFCRYQATGDWHGTWSKYSPQGKLIESFQGIRSLRTSEDGSEIYHQNHYTYADGKTVSKTFGPYQKLTTRALFLDNSFSWGSIKIKSSSQFAFETGFRYEDRRMSAGIVYDELGNLECITVISEHLGCFTQEPSGSPIDELSGCWLGTIKKIAPNWIVSAPLATSWKRLENIDRDYLTLHLADKVSFSGPQKLENGKDFLMAVDWQANPTLLQRGIRHFDKSSFTNFTLEIFSLSE